MASKTELLRECTRGFNSAAIDARYGQLEEYADLVARIVSCKRKEKRAALNLDKMTLGVKSGPDIFCAVFWAGYLGGAHFYGGACLVKVQSAA